jgi:hypothetical protein
VAAMTFECPACKMPIPPHAGTVRSNPVVLGPEGGRITEGGQTRHTTCPNAECGVALIRADAVPDSPWELDRAVP